MEATETMASVLCVKDEMREDTAVAMTDGLMLTLNYKQIDILDRIWEVERVQGWKYIRTVLASMEIFKTWDTIMIRMLARQVERKHLVSGQSLFDQGTPGRYLYIIAEGNVNLYREVQWISKKKFPTVNEQGDRHWQEVSFLEDKRVFVTSRSNKTGFAGEESCFGQFSTYQYNAVVTSSKCQVFVVPTELVLKLGIRKGRKTIEEMKAQMEKTAQQLEEKVSAAVSEKMLLAAMASKMPMLAGMAVRMDNDGAVAKTVDRQQSQLDEAQDEENARRKVALMERRFDGKIMWKRAFELINFRNKYGKLPVTTSSSNSYSHYFSLLPLLSLLY